MIIKKIPILLFLSFAMLSVFGQEQKISGNNSQKKLALVIGNGNYQLGILANPENDAKAMQSALSQLGFDVMEYEDLGQKDMKMAIDDFGRKLKQYNVGLFFYAGHGIQANGYNYLIPVDAQLASEQQVEYDCVQADRVLALMEASGSNINIIILDACRNNPFERSWTRSATGRGLAFMNAPSGSLIAYATAPGSTASDGSGKNGLYTSAILESIAIPDITILQMFQNVRNIVSAKSDKEQIPWESTSLTGDFYFNKDGKNINTVTQTENLNKDQQNSNSDNAYINRNLFDYSMDGVSINLPDGWSIDNNIKSSYSGIFIKRNLTTRLSIIWEKKSYDIDQKIADITKEPVFRKSAPPRITKITIGKYEALKFNLSSPQIDAQIICFNTIDRFIQIRAITKKGRFQNNEQDFNYMINSVQIEPMTH